MCLLYISGFTSSKLNVELLCQFTFSVKGQADVHRQAAQHNQMEFYVQIPPSPLFNPYF